MPEINAKFVFTAILVLFLPLGVMNYFCTQRTCGMFKDAALANMERRAALTARMAGRELLDSYSARDIIFTPAFAAASVQGKAGMLNAALSRRPDVYRRISLLNASGKEIARAGGGKSPMDDFSGDELFRAAAQSGQLVGAVEYSGDASATLVSADPLQDKSGKISGAVIAWLSLSRLDELLKTARTDSDTGETLLADESGVIIADSRPMSLVKPGSPLAKPLLEFRGKAKQSGTIRIDSRQANVAFQQIPGTKWTIYEVEDSSLACNCRALFRQRIFALAIAIIILSLLIERVATRMLLLKH